MNDILKSMLNLQELEQFARRGTWINRTNPTIKIIMTLIFILIVSFMGKYDLRNVIMLVIIPILVIIAADIPFKSVGMKLIIPIIMSSTLGIFNPFIDKEIVMMIGSLTINGGMISFLVIVIKTLATLTATLILVSTTTIEDIGKGLQTLRIPKAFIVLLLMTYRYICLLLVEVSNTYEAYQLRTSSKKGIHISTWGSLVGQIMIRSYKRSDEIYHAMLLRGYDIGDK